MTNTKTNTRTKEMIINDIIAYFENNEDVFNDCIEELDDYNGYLGDDRYFDMEEIDEFYRDTNPTELLQRVYFGYDEDDVIIDQWGEEREKEFNPMRDYFRYNSCGNLISTSYKDYSDHLDKYAIEAMNKDRYYIDSIEKSEELTALFDELKATQEGTNEKVFFWRNDKNGTRSN